MDSRYKLGQKPGRRRRTRVLIVMVITFSIIGAIAALIYKDLKSNQSGAVTGKEQTVLQLLDETTAKLTINEPTFVMQLPGDWKEIERKNVTAEKSITWQATKKNHDNRWFKVYIDTIPENYPINRLVPVNKSSGGELIAGDVSPNCATFTQGGTQNADQAQHLASKPAKYQSIDFICDLVKIVDNQVGAGSTDGVNTITLKGAGGSTHKYFFLYTDRNIQPDYSIFYNALKSFQAK